MGNTILSLSTSDSPIVPRNDDKIISHQPPIVQKIFGDRNGQFYILRI